MLSAVIRDIIPVQGGDALCVTLTLEGDGGSEARSFTVSHVQYADLPCLHPYAKAAGRSLTADEVEAIDAAAGAHAAAARAINLLSYGDVTERALVRKLQLRGIDEEAARSAAAAMEIGRASCRERV